MDNFQNALKEIFFVEGGYSDHPEDKGGKTKYGITEATYKSWKNLPYAPEIGVITKEEASSIYREMYWDEIRGDELPAGVALMVFDSAVHAGPHRAITWLQRAVGVRSDGILGPKTLLEANRTNRSSSAHEALQIVKKIAGQRLMMARKNETFVRGWFSRIIHILSASVEDVVT